MARTQPAGRRRPGDLPLVGRPPRHTRREDDPLDVGLRFLDGVRHRSRQHRLLLGAEPRARADEHGPGPAARGRRTGPRSGRHGAGADFLVYGRGRRVRPGGAPLASGLVHPLPTQCGRGSLRGGLDRRPRQAIPGRRGPGEDARARRQPHGSHRRRPALEHRRRGEGHRDQQRGVFHPRGGVHQAARGP